MSTSKSHRRGHEEKSRRDKLAEKSSSFHGRIPGSMGEKLLRPKTLPDLLPGANGSRFSIDGRPKLTKLLLNVTIQRSLGAVQVLMSPESTVDDLIAAALQQYSKEGRRPILHSNCASYFQLHYSQFSLESLDRKEKLITLGSRNFFLCPGNPAACGCGGGGGGGAVTAPSSSCSKHADNAAKFSPAWLKFMGFLLFQT